MYMRGDEQYKEDTEQRNVSYFEVGKSHHNHAVSPEKLSDREPPAGVGDCCLRYCWMNTRTSYVQVHFCRVPPGQKRMRWRAKEGARRGMKRKGRAIEDNKKEKMKEEEKKNPVRLGLSNQ
jgi:hypothetical protein